MVVGWNGERERKGRASGGQGMDRKPFAPWTHTSCVHIMIDYAPQVRNSVPRMVQGVPQQDVRSFD